MELHKEILRGHNGPVYAIASDGTFVYSSASDKVIARWNPDSATIDAFSVKLDSPAYSICCAENILFAGCTNGTIIAIDTSDRKLLWEVNYLGFPIFSIAWSPALNAILVGDNEGNLLAFSKSGERFWHFPLSVGKIRAITTADSCFYLGAQDGLVRCFDNLTLNEIWSQKAHNGSVYTILRTEEGILTGGMDGHMNQLSYLGEQLNTLPIHYQSVYGLAILGKYRVSCSKDKTIKIWDDNWKCVKRIKANEGHKRSVNAIIVHNNQLISASDDKTLFVWEIDKAVVY